LKYPKERSSISRNIVAAFIVSEIPIAGGKPRIKIGLSEALNSIINLGNLGPYKYNNTQ